MTPIDPADLAVLRSLSVEPNGSIFFETDGTPMPLPNTVTFSVEKVVGNKVLDVQIGGTTILGENGVANIPYASTDNPGAIRGSGDYAFRVTANGRPYVATQTAETYKTITNDWFIGKGTLNNVLAAPSVMPALTSSEKVAALSRLGIYVVTQEEYDLIADAESNGNIYFIRG